MEMCKFVSGKENSCGKLLPDVECDWSWSELILALKQSQGILQQASSSGTFDKFLDSVVARIESANEMSPCQSNSSPDSSSSDARSSSGSLTKNGAFNSMWWFEDLADLNGPVIEMLVRTMVSRKFTAQVVAKFLLCYQKARFGSASLPEERVEILERVVAMLCSFDVRHVPYKGLFRLLRIALNLNAGELCRIKLTAMIGSGLDRASLDDLLVPCRTRKNCMFDVDLVLTLLRSYTGRGVCDVLSSLSQVKKVGKLIDLYLSEIAPDRCLKPSKFLAVMRALPDFVRDSLDGVYRAVDLYLEVHKDLSEQQKMKVCSVLNYEKLSSKAIQDLIRNPNLPGKFVTQVLTFQQCKLKSLLQETNSMVATNITHPRSPSESDKRRTSKGCHQQVVLYTKKFYPWNENDKLRAHLQGMQWRAMELENVCYRMHVQMAKMLKSRSLSSRGYDAKFVQP